MFDFTGVCLTDLVGVFFKLFTIAFVFVFLLADALTPDAFMALCLAGVLALIGVDAMTGATNEATTGFWALFTGVFDLLALEADFLADELLTLAADCLVAD